MIKNVRYINYAAKQPDVKIILLLNFPDHGPRERERESTTCSKYILIYIAFFKTFNIVIAYWCSKKNIVIGQN